MGRAVKKENQLFRSWDFDKKNYIFFSIGILIIIIGYLIMLTGETDSFQSVKLAPTILLTGYVIIIPLSIFYRFGLPLWLHFGGIFHVFPLLFRASFLH